jgi:hypothetical protein
LGLPVATKLHQKNVPQVMFELQSWAIQQQLVSL